MLRFASGSPVPRILSVPSGKQGHRVRDWQLGPLGAFEDRWADPRLKSQSEAFLSKFVDGAGDRIENPSLLCRRNAEIDGQLPTEEEIQALELAIAFAFLDENPRGTPDSRRRAWAVLTADNTELYHWPVDLDAGYVTVTTGFMVRTLGGATGSAIQNSSFGHHSTFA